MHNIRLREYIEGRKTKMQGIKNMPAYIHVLFIHMYELQ